METILRRKQCFVLRLPNYLREQAAEIAKMEGTSLNYFIGLALAEKISKMQKSDPSSSLAAPCPAGDAKL
jgi:hypothetical protein